MPPNSLPANSSVTVDQTNNYLEDFGQLASPVPDLAATLTTRQDGDDDDFGPQRSRPPIASSVVDRNEDADWQRPPYLDSADFRHAHVQQEMHRRGMRRAAVQNRGPALTDMMDNLGSNQSPRRPSSRSHMSYHNWAPGSSDTDSARLRSWSTSTRPWQERATSPTPDPYRSHQRETDPTLFEDYPRSRNYYSRDSGLHNGQSHFVEDNANPDTLGMEPSLRTTALLQSVRRSARLSSASSQDQLGNWIVERARRRGDLSPPSMDQEPSPQPTSQTPSTDDMLLRQQRRHRDLAQLQAQTQHQHMLAQQRQAQLAQQRQAQQAQQRPAQPPLRSTNSTLVDFLSVDYSPTSPADPPDTARLFEEAIKYLDRQRSCATYGERIASAAMGGYIRGDWFNTQPEDFVLDTHCIDAPTETSWLRPGSVFSGSQHASNVQNSQHHANNSMSIISNYLSSSNTNHLPPPRDLAEFRVARMSSLSSSSSSTLPSAYPRPFLPHLDHPGVSSSSGAPDTWPVKVTIHTICFDSMTLTGTMEAFDVPDKSASYAPTAAAKKASTSITTFLTGEILDFNVHTLLTTSWNAKVAIDSTYWRKLGPFKNLADKEIVAGLTSRRWMKENVYEKWVLMRWKEKCFVTPSDAQSGLTISGFYYVCLRRSDGFLEGLYYDPLSSPYQHLELRAVGRGGGCSYGFR